MEYKVADYLNKVMAGEPYDLKTRLAEYIDYRRGESTTVAEGEAALGVPAFSGR